jgi:hypothetical protein
MDKSDLILAAIEQLYAKVVEVKADVVELKADVGELKTDMVEVKALKHPLISRERKSITEHARLL